ncbi:ester cyclase [Sinosporangium siamense]|uniref:Ester cyclase n=1 Tax=Sinosporangium siamense TaxID=1367973 RepID=A0A919RF18_9ACTN|nr:ester cyclase [Sinosporangium siamense]GII92710.1 hypothetical protein Ssi02_29410 [Sinosporangium siamense]
MLQASELRDRYLAGFNAHDLDTLLPTFSPRGVTITPEGQAEGREQLAYFLTELWTTFPDLHATVWESIDHTDTTVDEYQLVGTHRGPYPLPDGRIIPATGRPIRVRGCFLCSMEDGFIVSLRVYFDQLELLAQLGWFPFPSPGEGINAEEAGD